MPTNLWIRDDADPGSGWSTWPVADDALVIAPGAIQSAHMDDCSAPGAALLLRSRTPTGEQWLLMSASPSGVRVNGEPLWTGFRVLRDRDELYVDGVGRLFFSTETPAHVEPFPGAPHPVHCARSKLAIPVGADAVRCPSCRTWYLQSTATPAWVYSEGCLVCGHPTALDGIVGWTPDEL